MDLDTELQAMMKIMETLESFDSEAKMRIMDYVLKRYAIFPIAHGTTGNLSKNIPPTNDTSRGAPGGQPTDPQDIRSLKETKQPRSINEMTALAAYYVSEVRKDEQKGMTIGKQDIIDLFKQAGFKLPGDPKDALTNAKNAGFLDSTGTPGQYKLNSVGYNLIVHNLPSKQIRRSTPRKNDSKDPGSDSSSSTTDVSQENIQEHQ